MVYTINLVKLLFSCHDEFFRIKKAEKLDYIIRTLLSLILLSIFVYGLMSWIGLGTNPLSTQAITLSDSEYETTKLMFLIGRLLYGLIFAIFILFVPTLLFSLIYHIPYQKVLILQAAVLVIMLIERLTWIPLMLVLGVEWHLSPLSLGVLTSLITDSPLWITFFGAISIFQIWIIWYQVKFLVNLSNDKKGWIWTGVIMLHLFYWLVTAFISTNDIPITEWLM